MPMGEVAPPPRPAGKEKQQQQKHPNHNKTSPATPSKCVRGPRPPRASAPAPRRLPRGGELRAVPRGGCRAGAGQRRALSPSRRRLARPPRGRRAGRAPRRRVRVRVRASRRASPEPLSSPPGFPCPRAGGLRCSETRPGAARPALHRAAGARTRT
ncbi:unnamed protein product [Rangifer tarandus platyrhynchus]|uniref:Uncharacterized protein n=2 Tax=Rangifer tarandus platyrhynchus TaxID=3082113 RepID=A0ACB0DRA7_RANTA|nr:unnamed protein product [Rangifer tarandus platyrhynchus]CAI9690741.1 unnamed protein product [Rangifer tarandus platyrhynchus]